MNESHVVDGERFLISLRGGGGIIIILVVWLSLNVKGKLDGALVMRKM